MTPETRIDWLFIVVWTAILTVGCGLASLLAWLAQRILLAVGWDGVLVVVAVIGIAGVAMVARKDNPSW